MSERALESRSELQLLTLRSVATGMLLGAVLSLCNIYSGLKIGWTTNMSITAGLLGYGLWRLGSRAGARPFGIVENCMSQTAASAGASISSAGLVAPIPALTMLTGRTLAWQWLALWVFVVALVGVYVGVSLRRQMIEVDKLPFPFGIATAETLKEMYARGEEAMARVYMLLSAALVSALLKLSAEVFKLPKLGLPGSVSVGGVLAKKGVLKASLKQLSFVVDPSLLFVGVGMLIGMRACLSMLLGALAAWGVIAPEVLARGMAEPGKADGIWFSSLVKWMLWPGVAMMVAAALTSFSMSGRSIMRALVAATRAARARSAGEAGEVSRGWLVSALVVVAVLCLACQLWLFDIRWYAALFGFVLTFVLAIVAGRVSGETGITPVGAMGKVTQLGIGIVTPGDATANLMAANVTGGAASQCADMLHDLKTGQLLGAWPKHQAVAQVFGVLAGALAGSAAYLFLIPNPKEQLLTTQWPAPAVAQWKAVAEVFMKGLDTMPAGALGAMGVAAAVGVALSLCERLLPASLGRYVPSAASIGLAFVIPAYYALSIFAGGVIYWLLMRVARPWSMRFLVALAAGLIAGESLMGVGVAVHKMLAG